MINIYVDRKYEVWERSYYSLDAKSKEELIEKYGKDLLLDMLDPEDSEILFETMEFIPPEENDNWATIEVIDPKTDEVILNNIQKIEGS